MGRSPQPYDLTQSAESDLKEIAKQTLKKWNKKQAITYAIKLEECFQKISKNEIYHHSFSNRFPEIKCVKCEHHYVFYLLLQNKRPTIIAILYEHMDMLSRLGKRLSR